MKLIKILFIIVIIACCFCSPWDSNGQNTGNHSKITVLTQNLFVGANIRSLGRVKGFSNKIKQVDNLFKHVTNSDFKARAEALAREIKRISPDVICLQEVATWSAGRGVLPFYPNDNEYAINFLTILENELEDAGLNYTIAVKKENESIIVPSKKYKFISLTDYNVILTKDEIKILNTDGGHFKKQRIVGLGLLTFKFKKGWVSALIEKNGNKYNIINCHLDLVTKIKYKQIEEIFSICSKSKVPTILGGDFNMNPISSGFFRRHVRNATMYDLALRLNRHSNNTCCRWPKNLRNPHGNLTSRIDLIFATKNLRPLKAGRVGITLSSRGFSKKKYRLWISDHAGTWGSFKPVSSGKQYH